MSTPARKTNKKVLYKSTQGYVAAKVVVGLLGFTLSLVLHELFHVVMHWGNITHVNFFPNPWTVVQINTSIPPGYDLDGEEVIAYGITLLVIFITTIILFRMNDSDDKRTSGQILFPDDTKMQKMSAARMLKLSGLDADTPRGKKLRR
jgi:hypothetical protein